MPSAPARARAGSGTRATMRPASHRTDAWWHTSSPSRGLSGSPSTRLRAVDGVPVGVVSGDYDQGPGIATNLAWSPDGQRLAYIRFGTGEYGEFGYSIRILDARNGRRVASLPTGTESSSWSSNPVEPAGAGAYLVMRGFDWSPDGHYLIQAGFDAEITTIGGKRVAWLRGLRAVNPSWQSRCSRNR